jgi:hypothetical protein
MTDYKVFINVIGSRNSRIHEGFANSRTARDQGALKRNLLIFSDRILDSSVEAGTPS